MAFLCLSTRRKRKAAGAGKFKEVPYFVKKSPDKIRRAIGDLPQDDPAKCAELIRMLYNQIPSLKDDNEKEKLLNELKATACLGLRKGLKKMMERKGLRLESLDLVMKYLTNVPELAQYLYDNTKEEIEKAGFEIVNRRLGPDLEVLGGLSAAGVDVTKEWVKKLCRRAPSLQALPRLRLSELKDCCQGAHEIEMDKVYHLVETAESLTKQLSRVPQNENFVKQNKETKAVDEEKLKKARELMNEAKEMATNQSETAKDTVCKKLKMIMNALELPLDWLIQEDEVKPEQLFQQLDEIIEQCNRVLESSESYRNEVELITKVSAGRALCGIYYSEYEAPKPAAIPLLLVPTDVTLTSPNISQEMNFMKFSAKGAATDYVRTVESSSTNIGLGVNGFYDLLGGKVQGAYNSARRQQADHSVKTSSTSASVLHYIRTPKKSFRLERNEMKLCYTARKMAMSIVQDTEKVNAECEKSVRLFLDLYGSHFPAGVQTLGGVFFGIADAESKSGTETFTLTEAAVKHLKAQMSVGFLSGSNGIGGGVPGEHTSAEERSKGSHRESSTDIFTYSVKSMGPPVTKPASFHKLLSCNSTWALIDRGPVKGYIPVWELLRDLGSEYDTAANVLEQTWKCDENKRKVRQRQKMAKEELLSIKQDFTGRMDVLQKGGYRPKNANLIYTQDVEKMGIFDKAVEFIMEDPQHNICEVTFCDWYSFLVPLLHNSSTLVLFRLKCWKAPDDTPLEFMKHSPTHTLLFSKMLFKWKDTVPLQR